MSDSLGEESDLALIRDAKQFIVSMMDGEPADPVLHRAWDQFYHLYTGTIRRFVIRQGVEGLDVDDCVQEVWLYVMRKLGDFQCPARRAGFRSWLYRIVTSVAVDLFRERSKSPQHLQDGGEHVDSDSGPPSRNGEDGQLREWRRSMIATLLHKLHGRITKVNYRLIELRFLEGRSVVETAEILGLTPRQVWYRQHRVMARLRELAVVYTGGMFRPIGSVDAP